MPILEKNIKRCRLSLINEVAYSLSLKSYLETNKDIGYILSFQALVEKYNKLVIRKKYIIIYISLYFYKTERLSVGL